MIKLSAHGAGMENVGLVYQCEEVEVGSVRDCLCTAAVPFNGFSVEYVMEAHIDFNLLKMTLASITSHSRCVILW